MRRIYIIIGILAVLLFASCGRQHTAESLVKEFVSQHATEPGKMEVIDFGDLDSTKVIKDSLILDMQTREHANFKSGIDYTVKTSGRMLYFLRMKYVCEGDTLQQTFYMDENLQQIVAFK